MGVCIDWNWCGRGYYLVGIKRGSFCLSFYTQAHTVIVLNIYWDIHKNTIVSPYQLNLLNLVHVHIFVYWLKLMWMDVAVRIVIYTGAYMVVDDNFSWDVHTHNLLSLTIEPAEHNSRSNKPCHAVITCKKQITHPTSTTTYIQ